jgi:hypothetical protein
VAVRSALSCQYRTRNTALEVALHNVMMTSGVMGSFEGIWLSVDVRHATFQAQAPEAADIVAVRQMALTLGRIAFISLNIKEQGRGNGRRLPRALRLLSPGT